MLQDSARRVASGMPEFRFQPIATAVLLSLACAVTQIGCTESGPPSDSGEATGALPDAPPSTSELDAEITLRVGDRREFDSLLEEYRGKVILIDYWATWCTPCEEQFVHTVRMHRKFHDQGLAVISVSLDDDVHKEKALEFLRSQGATFDNLMSPYSMADLSFDVFEIDNGSVPHYQLYDRQGQLARKFATGDPIAEQFTYDDVEAAIVELLHSAPQSD